MGSLVSDKFAVRLRPRAGRASASGVAARMLCCSRVSPRFARQCEQRLRAAAAAATITATDGQEAAGRPNYTGARRRRQQRGRRQTGPRDLSLAADYPPCAPPVDGQRNRIPVRRPVRARWRRQGRREVAACFCGMDTRLRRSNRKGYAQAGIPSERGGMQPA